MRYPSRHFYPWTHKKKETTRDYAIPTSQKSLVEERAAALRTTTIPRMQINHDNEADADVRITTEHAYLSLSLILLRLR